MKLPSILLAALLLTGCATTGSSGCSNAGSVAGGMAHVGGWVAAGLPGPLALVTLPIAGGAWLIEQATRKGCEAAQPSSEKPAPTPAPDLKD